MHTEDYTYNNELNDLIYILYDYINGERKGDDNYTMGYGDNQKHLNINSSGNATFTGIVNVSGAGLKITGANAAHLAAALVLGYEGSSKSQIRAYGADGSTKGTLEFNMSESDGGESIVMLLDGNSRISLSNNDTGVSNTIFGICFKQVIFISTLFRQEITSGNISVFKNSSSCFCCSSVSSKIGDFPPIKEYISLAVFSSILYEVMPTLLNIGISFTSRFAGNFLFKIFSFFISCTK